MGRLLMFVIGAIVLLWVVGFIVRLGIRLIIFGTLAIGVLYLVGMFQQPALKPLSEGAMDSLVPLAERVIEALARRSWSVVSAESCTGGLIGHALTEVAGSSAVYLGGIIAYANAVKIHQLQVPEPLLEAVGAVSAETARAMAEGVRTRLSASVGLSTTGIAGPGGGSPEKPVGLVYLGLALPDQTLVERHIWDGDRHTNKLRSVDRSLRWLLEILDQQS